MSSRRIYLAGPEVFLPNATAVGEQKKALCRHYGFEGLFPLDSELTASSPEALAYQISEVNEQLIRNADLLIANLTPFRGPSADVGTVYELGFARGLGKPVYGYSHDDSLFLQRSWQLCGIGGEPGPAGDVRDSDGLKIEEFGLRDNLMIEGGLRQSGSDLLVQRADAASRYSDLRAFESLLQQLSRLSC